MAGEGAEERAGDEAVASCSVYELKFSVTMTFENLVTVWQAR